MTETNHLDELPAVLKVTDIASYLQIDAEAVRILIRKHKHILEPFRLGKEIRIKKERFTEFYEKLTTNQLN